MTMTDADVAAALRIAADLSSSSLNPAYATPAGVQIAAAVATGDPAHLAAVTELLDVYADAAGIHDPADGGDLGRQLGVWVAQLRAIATNMGAPSPPSAP